MSACLRLCTAASCRSRGATALLEHCRKALASDQAQLRVKEVGCLGPCSDGPLLAIDPAERLLSLQEVNGSDLETSLAEALQGGNAATGLQQWQPSGSRELSPDEPFWNLQRRLVLGRCGVVDPESLADALAAGAWKQLPRVLEQNDPAAVIEIVRRSGLRGRGGAGYPTGLKWATVAAMPGSQKVVVCNADEGDPGAFMDRTLMEGDPHRLLEGMAIAAFAIGAQRVVNYVRAD